MAWTERYCRADAEGGGDGTADTAAAAWTLDEMLAAAAAGQRVNIRAGTYSIGASKAFTNVGTTTQPIWFRGFNTTPGDIDTDESASPPTKPAWVLGSTFAITATGAHQIWSGLNITGVRSGSICDFSGTAIRAYRMRFENTSSNAAAIAVGLTGGGARLYWSYAKTPATATTTGTVNCSSAVVCIGVVAEGSGRGGFCTSSTNGQTFRDCIAINGVNGIVCAATGGMLLIQNCTVRNMTGAGVLFTALPGQGSIDASLFSTCGTYGINNATGVNTNLIARANNSFHACTTANENGFGDSPSLFETTETIDPILSATDLRLDPSALARNTGTPGYFENQTFRSLRDKGAVQLSAVLAAIADLSTRLRVYLLEDNGIDLGTGADLTTLITRYLDAQTVGDYNERLQTLIDLATDVWG